MDLKHNKNIIQMEKARSWILMDIETLWETIRDVLASDRLYYSVASGKKMQKSGTFLLPEVGRATPRWKSTTKRYRSSELGPSAGVGCRTEAFVCR